MRSLPPTQRVILCWLPHARDFSPLSLWPWPAHGNDEQSRPKLPPRTREHGGTTPWQAACSALMIDIVGCSLLCSRASCFPWWGTRPLRVPLSLLHVWWRPRKTKKGSPQSGETGSEEHRPKTDTSCQETFSDCSNLTLKIYLKQKALLTAFSILSFSKTVVINPD